MNEIMDEFISESKEHLASVEDDLLTLESQKDCPDAELIAKIFRSVHTVKGSSGFLGLQNVMELSHLMETLLSMIREGDIKPETKYIEPLLRGIDLLNTMIDDVEHSDELDIKQTLEELEHLIRGTSPEADSDLDEVVTVEADSCRFEMDVLTLKQVQKGGQFLYVLRYDLNDLYKRDGVTPLTLIEELSQIGNILQGRLSSPVENLLEKLETAPLYYDVLYASILESMLLYDTVKLPEDRVISVDIEDLLTPSQGDAKVIDTEEDTSGEADVVQEEDQVQLDVPTAPDRKTVDAGDDSDEEPVTRKRAGGAGDKASGLNTTRASSSIRIKVDILEELMRLAGELVLIRNQQLMLAEQSDGPIKTITQRLNIVTSEMQETIMQTRMQPIGNIFSKFPRVVRDLSHKLNKEINLITQGEEVELDKSILESLTDPLTHMVRNCCDHAIETVAERTQQGKPGKGKVAIRAYHDSGHIVVEVEDDGRGLAVEDIRDKALSKGLKTEDQLAAMTDKEILALIMLPGFTTAVKVSDVSGRGVGMDVVRSSIEKLGGTLDFESKPGKGTRFIMRLPLTLAIIPCLIIKVGDEQFAIPQINLEELVCLYDEEVFEKIESTGDREVYRLRNHLLPMVRLSEILSHSSAYGDEDVSEMMEKYNQDRKQLAEDYREAREANDKSRLAELQCSLNIAFVKAGNRRFGLIIDEVIGTEEVVVKPMHSALKALGCYAGATVMGDGKVALILNVEGVANHAAVDILGHEEDGTQVDDDLIAAEDEIQRILLFRNGPDEQFAVSLPLIRRIERINRGQLERVGNRYFCTVDNVSTQVISLDSVLTVSSCVDKEELFLLLPKHIQKPFGILVSSLDDVCEISLNILNSDSYMEDGLLGTGIIDNQMTLFIDIYRLIEIAEPDWFNERKEKHPAQPRGTILVLEDSSFFQQMVKQYLETDGYQVVKAKDGLEGLACLDSEQIDLIVSDLNMPRMDGFDFIREVRKKENGHHIPAIALSSLNSDEDIERAKESGFDAYNTKIDREKLLAEVSSLLIDMEA